MNYHLLLPVIVTLGIVVILVTTFTVVDTSAPPPQATPAPTGTTTTSATTTSVSTTTAATTTPAPVCPVAEEIFTGISAPVVLTSSGYFRYQEFYDYTNSLVISALPPSIIDYYPEPPTPPIQVTAAAEYLGDLYLTLNGVPVLYSLASGARGLVLGGYMNGFAVQDDFFYGAVDTNMLKMNPNTASLADFVHIDEPIYSVTVNPVTQNAFVLEQTGSIAAISLSTGATTPTCLTGTNYTSISFDSSGQMWAFKDGSLDRFPTEPI